MLLSIQHLAAKARAAGLKVHGGNSYVEIWSPGHNGPEAIWSGGSCYGTAEIILNDQPSGYGYNEAFYGPWHPGMVQSTSTGVRKLAAVIGEVF